MRDYPNTEATISEIMGAISLRVLCSVINRMLKYITIYFLYIVTAIFAESYFDLEIEWDPKWAVPIFTICLWVFISEATGNRSFHRAKWYFPKTNGFTSFVLSAYLVISAWALFAVGKGLFGGILFLILYGIPVLSYYILNCGYYLVMMRRYPKYRQEDFAIPIPSALLNLSKKKGGIDGTGNDEEWNDVE